MSAGVCECGGSLVGGFGLDSIHSYRENLIKATIPLSSITGELIWILHSVSSFKHLVWDLLGGTMEETDEGCGACIDFFSILFHLNAPPHPTPPSFVEHLSFLISCHQSLQPCWVKNCTRFLWHAVYRNSIPSTDKRGAKQAAPDKSQPSHKLEKRGVGGGISNNRLCKLRQHTGQVPAVCLNSMKHVVFSNCPAEVCLMNLLYCLQKEILVKYKCLVWGLQSAAALFNWQPVGQIQNTESSDRA